MLFLQKAVHYVLDSESRRAAACGIPQHNAARRRVAFPPEGDLNERGPEVSTDWQQQVDNVAPAEELDTGTGGVP
jgi:hypothetical protein